MTEEKTAPPETRLVIVAGSGRSGSSMLMWMLEGGGLDVTGHHQYFEDPRSMEELDLEFVRSFRGATKILDPHRYLPKGLRLSGAKAIWIDRDRKQQARSWIKKSEDIRRRKMRITDNLPRNDVHQIMRMLKQSRKQGVPCLADVTGNSVLCLTYENIVAKPHTNSVRIAEFLGMDLDTRKMALRVIPRKTSCMQGMLENDLARMGPTAVQEMIVEKRGGVVV